jgi:hypothetical protein
MCPRGHHAALGILDVDDAIALEAGRPDEDPIELLARHGLDRIAPELRDQHPPTSSCIL